MPCNPFAPDFLDCLAQEQAAQIKKKIVESLLAGAVSVLTANRLLHLQLEIDIASLPLKVRNVAIEMQNEGMFKWSEQELQEWLDNQP